MKFRDPLTIPDAMCQLWMVESTRGNDLHLTRPGSSQTIKRLSTSQKGKENLSTISGCPAHVMLNS